jgi:hypothetical protein
MGNQRNKVECDEGSLRELFSSREGADDFVLEAIGSGLTLVVQMNDGTRLELSQREQTLRFLTECFGYGA